MARTKVNKILNIKQIVFDEDLYPRTHTAWQTIYDYQQSMRTGSIFPLITVAKYRNQYVLVDGKHRLEAMRLNKEEVIKAEILIGLTKKQIYIEAVKLNSQHGRPLNVTEKVEIITNLETLGLNIKEISTVIGVPVDKLSKFKASRITEDAFGVKIVIKPALKHFAKDGLVVSEEDVSEQSLIGGYNQIQLVSDLVLVFRNKWIDWKNQELMNRMKVLKIFMNKYKKI